MSLEAARVIPSAELAISNISWPNTAEAHGVAMQVLAKTGLNAIDIAPMMVFPGIVGASPDTVDREELIAFRRTLRHESGSGNVGEIRVAGMQGITFGRTENMFSDDPQERSDLVKHMKGIIHLAEFVGAQTIVYGCLGSRLFDNRLPGATVEERATDFFTRLDPVARDSNVVIGIEPVSSARAKEGTTAFGRSADEVVDFASKIRAEYDTTQIRFLPDSFGIHDGQQGRTDVSSVSTAFNNGVLSPHAQIAESGMAAPSLGSEIGRTHAALDEALHTAFANESVCRLELGSPPPTLAIEMYSPNDISMPELAAALHGAINAARHYYSATLGTQ